MHVSEAIRSRRSIRAFSTRSVDRSVVDAILSEAAWAPSGSNMQPWIVHAVAGEALQALRAAARAAFEAGSLEPAWAYYPNPIPEPYLARRRACGFGLYGHLGIERGDQIGRQRQHARNYELFDAPVALFFFMDSRLARGSWLDYGMYLQNVMLLARAHGLDTCPQAAWLDLHHVVREQLAIPASLTIVCGMALGYRDAAARINEYQPPREPAATFTTWHGPTP